jgi:hypothetical protein
MGYGGLTQPQVRATAESVVSKKMESLSLVCRLFPQLFEQPTDSLVSPQRWNHPEYLQRLQQACVRVGGDFTLLWHNSSFVTEAEREIYTTLLDG